MNAPVAHLFLHSPGGLGLVLGHLGFVQQVDEKKLVEGEEEVGDGALSVEG